MISAPDPQVLRAYVRARGPRQKPAPTADQISQMRLLRAMGKPCLDIGLVLGCSETTVAKHTRDVVAPDLAAERRAIIRQMYLDGEKLDVIAQTVGLGTSSIHYHVRDLPRRAPEGGRPCMDTRNARLAEDYARARGREARDAVARSYGLRDADSAAMTINKFRRKLREATR